MSEYSLGTYDVVVIGAGHAGCEAALAAARMGKKTAAFVINLDTLANMPCNPSIGGTSKGHLVREIDALGGEMAKNADKTFLQSKMLNTSTWTIQNLRKNCGMPYIKLGGRFYYDVNEVDTWFRSNVHCDKPAPLYSSPASQRSNKAMAKIY